MTYRGDWYTPPPDPDKGLWFVWLIMAWCALAIILFKWVI